MMTLASELLAAGVCSTFLLRCADRRSPVVPTLRKNSFRVKFLDRDSTNVATLLSTFDAVFDTGLALVDAAYLRASVALPPLVRFFWGDLGPNLFGWSAATQLVVCNERTSEAILRLVPSLRSRVHVIDNPVTLTPLVTDTPSHLDRSEVRQQLGLPADSFVVGTLARYVSGKRLQRLIVEAAPFLRSVANARLLIAGSGSDDPRSTWHACTTLVKDLDLDASVALLDYTPTPRSFLDALDLYVTLSASEGQSIAVSEAMWCRLPIVATAVGGTDRQLPPEHATGIRIAPYGPTDLSRILADLHADASWRDSLGRAAATLARERFHPTDYGQRIVAVLDKAAATLPIANPLAKQGLCALRLLIVTYAGMDRVSPRVRAHLMGRCLSPFNISVTVVRFSALALNMIDKADVVVFHRVAQWLLSASTTIERDRRWHRLRFAWTYSRQRKPTGYDLDDYLFVPDSQPSTISDENVYFLKSASFVLANSKAATRRLRAWNGRVATVPNPLPEELWQASLYPPRLSTTPVVAWVAGRTHDRDMLFAYEVFEAIKARCASARCSILGGRPTPKTPRGVLHVPSVPWHQVPYYLSQATVSIAPLEYTKENRCKGHGHIAEPAMLEIPSVAQDVDSYREAVTHGIDGYLAKDPNDFAEFASMLCHDSTLRTKVGTAARRRALETYGAEVVGWQYRKVLDAALNDG